jgi:hypothetical protein
MQENFPPAATGALRMQLSLTEPDTLFEHLLQDLPAETSNAHIPLALLLDSRVVACEDVVY